MTRHPSCAREALERLVRDEAAPIGRILRSLNPEQRSKLGASAVMTKASRGDMLVEEGSVTTRVCYVLDGTAAMKKTLADGREHIIGLLVPTDMYGRVFDGPSAYWVEALSDVEGLCFDRAAFEALLAEEPHVERQFLVTLQDELDVAREWLLLLSGTRLIERVASFLMILARRRMRDLGGRAPGDAPLEVTLPLRRDDLAQYLGTRRESFSRAVHELEARGVIAIRSPSRFVILDPEALIEVSGNDLVTGPDDS